MIRPSRTARLAIVAASAALVLSSCGSDDDTAEPSGGGETSSSAPSGEGDGTLVVGSLLPTTGDLAFLGPPEIAGVETAIADINAAGGYNGTDVVYSGQDSGDGTPNIAPASADKLLSENTDVIVGTASSSVSLSVLDKIVGAGVVMFSPANTSPEMDTVDDKDLYFRTAPSDVLQGAVMANLLLADGNQNIGILARQDSYGQNLADQVEKGVVSGGGKVAAKVLYSADASNYTADVNKVAAAKPDAVVLIAFSETTKIIPTMIGKGIGPQDVPVYFVDGNTADYSKEFDPGTLEGVKGTLPGAEVTDDFAARLLETDPSLTSYSYGPESYDATVLSVLGAIAAGDDAGVSIGAELIGISEGGTKCTTFEECAGLLADGEDIDYDGLSGPIEFGDTGSPTQATIGVYQYAKDNTNSAIQYIPGAI